MTQSGIGRLPELHAQKVGGKDGSHRGRGYPK
jgi:hypothetical protein